MAESPVGSTPAANRRAPSVTMSIESHVAVIEMRRPPANYFDDEVITALTDAAALADADPDCRVMVLCSQGRHFCAGANFGGDGAFADDRSTMAEKLYTRGARLFATRKPIIAAVQGAAVGGGLGLACAADFRVADTETRFVANFAKLGIHQGFGLTVTLPAIVGQQIAADLFYRGATVRGEEATRIGLADRLAQPGRQRHVAIGWARDIAAAAPLAIESIRATLRAGMAERVSDALLLHLVQSSLQLPDPIGHTRDDNTGQTV